MAIDPKLLVLKPVSELETVNNPTTGSLLFYDGGDELKKTGVADFYNAMQSAYLGIATTTTTPPATGAYWYRVDAAGTYINFGGIVFTQNEIDNNYAYLNVKNGVSTKELKAFVVSTATANIPTWTATSFSSGSQVFYNGKIYEASSPATSAQIPGIASVWVEKISGGELLKYFDLISNLAEVENLFNINSPLNQNNFAIYDATWDITPISGFGMSYWIPLLPSTQYSIVRFGLSGKNMQFTDASKVKIGGVKVVGDSATVPFTFTTSANCYGMYYTIKSIAESIIPPQLMVVKGNGKKANGELLDFIPYGTPTEGEEIIQIKAKGDNLIFADRLQVGAKMGLNTVATLADIPDSSGQMPLPLFTKVIASGTSITNGVGSNNSNGIDEAKTWRKYLLDSLNNCLGRAISVVNGGVNGQNTTGMKTNLGALLSGNTNQIVIIEGAINDAQTAGAGLALSVTKSNLENMVDSVIASGNVPILTTPMPINYTSEYGGYYTVQKRNDLSFIVRLVAKNKNIRLVDLDLFTNSDSNLLADGLHPNAKGHAFIANAITSKLV